MTASAWYVTTQTRWIESVLFFYFISFLTMKTAGDWSKANTHTHPEGTQILNWLSPQESTIRTARDRALESGFQCLVFLYAMYVILIQKKKKYAPFFRFEANRWQNKLAWCNTKAKQANYWKSQMTKVSLSKTWQRKRKLSRCQYTTPSSQLMYSSRWIQEHDLFRLFYSQSVPFILFINTSARVE